MMGLIFYQVDAFADEPFTGNPAVVYLLPEPWSASRMQAVAREMSAPETAFLVRRDDGRFDIRWFTPKLEEMLCGHATLASAHVLWESGEAPPDDEVRFLSQSGPLRARRAKHGIELDFPTQPPAPATPPPFLLDALGVRPRYVGKNLRDYLIEVETEEEVRAVVASAELLVRSGAMGVIVTSRASGEFDFISRYFAPGEDVLEDPVTGSAHCCLGAFWAERLGKADLLAFQASSRGGVIRVRLEGDRTMLLGKAVTVIKGELLC